MTKDAIQCYRDTSSNIGIFSAIKSNRQEYNI